MEVISHKPWYRHPARVGFLLFLMMFVVVVIGFLAMTAQYWWQIKQGTSVAPANFSFSSRGTVKGGQIDRAKIESGLNPFLVRSGGPITIVQFMDYKCPFSKAAFPIINQIIGKYGSKVNLIIRNFPGESVYPGSRNLSKVAFCAFRQGRFLKAHDFLFKYQNELNQTLTPELISDLAGNIGLNESELNSCLNDPATADKIDKDLFDGVEAGVRGTPTFIVNGQKIEGVVPFESWEKYIESIIQITNTELSS